MVRQLRGEVDDIVDSNGEYLESCADEPPSVIGEFSLLVDVVDDRKVGIWNRLMIHKSSTQHRSSSNYCRNLHNPEGIIQLLNSAIKIPTRKRKKGRKRKKVKKTNKTKANLTQKILTDCSKESRNPL